MASNIAIQISSNVQQAVNGINSVNQRLEALQKDTESVSSRFQRFSSIAGGAIIAFNTIAQAIQKVAGAVRFCVEAYSAQEQAERRLQTVLTATQNAVGMSASELYNLADSLSKVTTYSDQEILAVEQMLAATRRIGRDVMPEATRAVLDMAAATGDDAAGAAHDLAQALADPAGEIESLKEKGIQLTEEQAENIKKVQEQNGVYEAQKLLLKEVAETYGGMAEAIASTDTGKLQQISNVWNDIKEGLGEGLLNTIGPALDTLYEKLVDINNVVQLMLQGQETGSTAADIRNTGQGISSETPDEVLERVIRESPYGQWLNEYSRLNPEASDHERTLDIYRQVYGTQRFTREDVVSYAAAVQEMERRSRASSRQSQLALNGITGSLSVPVPSIRWQDNLITPYADAFLESGIHYAAERERESSLASRRTESANALNSFLDQYGGLSSSRQVSAINDAIMASQQWMAEADPNSDTYKQLKEINEALYEQRDALLDIGEASKTWQEELTESIPDIVDNLMSIGDSFADIMQNMADAAADKLQEIQDKWDEYFDDLDEKQGRQAESLNAMLASGNISYEDYIDAMNDLDKTREESQEEARKEEEEQRKKANELGEAAFRANQANQIAQAAMDSASAIANIWSEHAGNPVMAGVLTGLAAAAIATQIAAISSQQYTPMAAGGITQGPTRTLLGEGNPHELVMPLTEGNLERFGLGSSGEGGVINITVNIGAAYTGEQLSEDVFRGIERAQRTGALPHWRYA